MEKIQKRKKVPNNYATLKSEPISAVRKIFFQMASYQFDKILRQPDKTLGNQSATPCLKNSKTRNF